MEMRLKTTIQAQKANNKYFKGILIKLTIQTNTNGKFVMLSRGVAQVGNSAKNSNVFDIASPWD